MQANKLTSKAVSEIIGAIAALDLESIKTRLMDPEIGKGWTPDHADATERAYRRFLRVVAKNQEHAADILLSRDVDEFWHAHILDTVKYAADCERVFGTFLHHAPEARAGTAEEAR